MSKNGKAGNADVAPVAPRKPLRVALDRDEWCHKTHTEMRVGSPNQRVGINSVNSVWCKEFLEDELGRLETIG